jgi:hypothetical protein
MAVYSQRLEEFLSFKTLFYYHLCHPTNPRLVVAAIQAILEDTELAFIW